MYVHVANAKWKIGFASKSAGSLTHAIAPPADLRHVAKLPVYLLREALKEQHRETYPGLGIALSATERAWGRAMLDEIAGGDGPVVALFTAATGGKHLGADWWQDFAARCASAMPGARIVEIVPLAGRSVLDNRWPTYYSTDLRRLAAVLSAASRVVAADCGVMHLACAANVPTAGLFRGTNIPEWGPYGSRDLALDVTSVAPAAVVDMLTTIDEPSPK
jgi:ADP-heptose:LPS heptosyltransferase